tara:strand:+ start:23365 stop:23694 length:330 start_codon:yes stop_codon:yes gene_type:complete
MNFGKYGLLVAILGLVFAAIPVVQRDQMSTTERFASDMKESVNRLKRHVAEDSKFELSFKKDRIWHSLAIICAVIGAIMGFVSLSTEMITGSLAVVIGLAVAAWEYFGA